MLPSPPPPGAGRAATIGFPLGGIIALIVTTIVRYLVHGMDSYLVDVQLMDKLFAGWFWEDEATFMIFLLGGAFGFLWGAGMTYDFSKPRAPRQKTPRIPVDPDAPPDLDRNLIAPLFEAMPAIVVVIVVLGIVLVALGVLPLTLTTVEQTTNESASPSQYGETDFGLLGLVSFDGASKAVVFVGFAALVIGAIVGTGLGLALLFYLLNREVKTVEVKTPSPLSERNGTLDRIFQLNNRLIAFFTNWALDVLDAVSSAVRPR